MCMCEIFKYMFVFIGQCLFQKFDGLAYMFLIIAVKKCCLGCCSRIAQNLTKFNISSQFFASDTPFSFPLFHIHEVFAWSFSSLHLQAMGKQCTNSNSVDGGDLSKGSQFFASDTPFSFPLFHVHEVFAWSFCSLHLQVMGKQCTNSNSVNGGDLSKGCRGTLDHVQGSPQCHNILFCHSHNTKMPSSQQTIAYCNAMSQSNIKGKQCTSQLQLCEWG